MQNFLEHLGIAVAAATGVLAARGKAIDLFGVMVLAVVTAFGGGTLRDVMLGDFPVMWVLDPGLLLNAVTVAVIVFFVARRRELPVRLLVIADAGALALFTAIGVQKALDFHTELTIAVAMGVITGVAGGILRDLLTGEIPLVFRRAIYLYATAALAGATTLALLQKYFPDWSGNLVTSVIVTLALRLAGIRWKLALPLFQTRAGS